MLSVECLPSLYWTKNGKNNTLKILFLVDAIGTNLKTRYFFALMSQIECWSFPN